MIRLYTEIVERLLAQKLNPVGAQRLMRVIKSCTKLSVACSSVHSHVSLCSFHLLFNQRARRGTRTMTSIQYGNARHTIKVFIGEKNVKLQQYEPIAIRLIVKY